MADLFSALGPASVRLWTGSRERVDAGWSSSALRRYFEDQEGRVSFGAS